jgi:hypothetical protein
MTAFIQGLQLSGLYYREAVRPILDASFPGIPHTAALIGYGSDVIGFDTQQSTDHMWGPRLVLFLEETGFDVQRELLDDALRNNLPKTFRGYTTNFGSPDDIGVRLMKPVQDGPVDHLIEIVTLSAYFQSYLGIDPRQEIGVLDWLSFSEHHLLAVTSGAVFHDDLQLHEVRHKLAYYPKDIWLYLLSSQWGKISQEDAFVGRTGVVGDELGSRIIAAHLVKNIMSLCFLMERRYAPYSKWFGSAFAQLDAGKDLSSLMEHVLKANDWHQREEYLSQVYENIARRHNALGITDPLPDKVSQFHGRPYQVIQAGNFATAIAVAIQDERVGALPPMRGSINQLIELTDVVDDTQFCRRMRQVWES